MKVIAAICREDSTGFQISGKFRLILELKKKKWKNVILHFLCQNVKLGQKCPIPILLRLSVKNIKDRVL